MDYHNKIFKAIQNTENGEINEENKFHYFQEGNILTCDYSGGAIMRGHLIGIVDDKGKIEMRYHQVNQKGQLLTGRCTSTPEMMENGKIRLYEKWEWTSGDFSKGTSILEEI